jgi:hypothetical protein
MIIGMYYLTCVLDGKVFSQTLTSSAVKLKHILLVGMPSTRKNKLSRKNRRNNRVSRRGGGMLSATAPTPQQPSLPGGLSSVLPNDNWHRWTSYNEAKQWGPHTAAPAPLANGGLYTNPQSTAPWGSSPFPATQHAFALEAAKVSGLPEVAYHQRPNDNFGASYSPVIGTSITPNHWSASGPMGPIVQQGGNSRRNNRKSKRNNRKNRRNGRKN